MTYLVVAVGPTARLLLDACGQVGPEWFDREEFAHVLGGVQLRPVLSITVSVNSRMACELVAAAETFLAARMRARERFLAGVSAYVAGLMAVSR